VHSSFEVHVEEGPNDDINNALDDSQQEQDYDSDCSLLSSGSSELSDFDAENNTVHQFADDLVQWKL